MRSLFPMRPIRWIIRKWRRTRMSPYHRHLLARMDDVLWP